jgi:hypothetical protein
VVTDPVFDYLDVLKVAKRLVALEIDRAGLDARDYCVIRKDSGLR